MNKHIFDLRLGASYAPPENEIAALAVDVLVDGE